MCLMGSSNTSAPKADPVSVSVPTSAGANSGVNDGATGKNGLTAGAANNGVSPAEEFTQTAPRKKSENTAQANPLAIGTKKYRTSSNVSLGNGSSAPTTGVATGK